MRVSGGSSFKFGRKMAGVDQTWPCKLPVQRAVLEKPIWCGLLTYPPPSEKLSDASGKTRAKTTKKRNEIPNNARNHAFYLRQHALLYVTKPNNWFLNVTVTVLCHDNYRNLFYQHGRYSSSLRVFHREMSPRVWFRCNFKPEQFILFDCFLIFFMKMCILLTPALNY